MEIELVSIQKIVDLCGSLHLDQDTTYRRSKILINNYHDIVWVDAKKVEMQNAKKTDSRKDPDLALLYLAEFDPSDNIKFIRHNMFLLFDAEWLKDIVDSAKEHVLSFSKDGGLYCEILDEYLTQKFITARERQKNKGTGKSSFYRKRNGAFLLFGVSLWGILIPYRLNLYSLSDCQSKRLLISKICKNGFIEPLA